MLLQSHSKNGSKLPEMTDPSGKLLALGWDGGGGGWDSALSTVKKYYNQQRGEGSNEGPGAWLHGHEAILYFNSISLPAFTTPNIWGIQVIIDAPAPDTYPLPPIFQKNPKRVTEKSCL